jgi:hypothetical protein
MSTIAGLIILSGIGAWISVKARAAGPALFFGVVAALLFCTTPLGSWIPGMLSSVSNGVAEVGGRVVTAGGVQ